MRFRTTALLALVSAPFAHPQHLNSRASFLDVSGRQQILASTTSPLLLADIRNLPSCVTTPAIPAPPVPVDIPHHHLCGSSGPINPEEAIATSPYTAFEHRITAGMNQYIAPTQSC